MPVHAEITSPTIWPSTQTRINGVSPCSAASSALSFSSSARRVPASGALFQLAPDLANPAHQRGFLGKAFFQCGQCGGHLRPLFADLYQPLRVVRAAAASRESTRSCVSKSSICRVASSMAGGVAFCPGQARASRIQHADGLSATAAPPKTGGRAAPPPRRFVQNADLVVLLQRCRDAPQHGMHWASSGSSTFTTGSAAPAPVFLEILLILGPRGGGDGSQFAARQRRFQQVGRVTLAACPPAPIMCGLVDEQDDGSGDDFTSSMSPFSRFSNSPLMPAPACNSARSSVRR